jgi:hypothetical protein
MREWQGANASAPMFPRPSVGVKQEVRRQRDIPPAPLPLYRETCGQAAAKG